MQTPDNTSGRPATRFLVFFLSIISVFYLLVLSPWVDAHVLYPVMEASARGASLMLGLFGIKTEVEGVVVRGANYVIAVRRGCDPVEPIVLFAAGVVAFRAPWKRKWVGLTAGAAILFCLNLVRLCTLFMLGTWRSPLLDSFHLDWWPAFYLVFALALWVLWLRWMQSAQKASGIDRPDALKPQAVRP
jgi:exosortase H (IPTLxxWG-CTERM-specific)